MRSHMMASYVDLLIKTCHRRGIFAMGGMAAQIPIRNDNAANQAALAKVRLYLSFLFGFLCFLLFYYFHYYFHYYLALTLLGAGS